jgi:hypothetical protein
MKVEHNAQMLLQTLSSLNAEDTSEMKYVTSASPVLNLRKFEFKVSCVLYIFEFWSD